MKNQINIETRRETEDDCYYWEAKAFRGNLIAFGHAYSEEQAISRAKGNLINLEMGLNPKTPNWENTEIASLVPLCCVDYSPEMCELSI